MSDTDRAATLLAPEQLERIKGLTLVARRVVEGALHGLHRAPHFGPAVEFVQHRQYSPGDELKHLDWQVLARSDRYVVRQFEQDTNLRAVLVLDASRSMAFAGSAAGSLEPDDATAATTGTADTDEPAEYLHSKLRYGQELAAALGYLMLRQGDSVGLVTCSDAIAEQVSPRAAPGHFARLCGGLLQTRAAGQTDLAAVIAQLAQGLARRSLVVLISDLFDDPEAVVAALGRLHHRGHEVIVYQVLHRDELQFDLGPAGRGKTVIRDMETGGQFEAEPHLIRDLVRRQIDAFLARLDAGVRRHRIDLVRCDTQQPLEQVLGRHLQRRASRKRR